MIKKIRFGIIGCGAIGTRFDAGKQDGFALTHAKAITRSTQCELVALCDTNEDYLADASRVYKQATPYADYRDMLNQASLDAVSICTPPKDRLSMMQAIAAANIKLIWCEKPFAATVDEAHNLVTLLNQHHIVCNVNYLRRHSRLLQRLRDALEARTYGDLQSLQVLYSKGLANNGSHMIDLLMALLGEPQVATPLLKLKDERPEDPTILAYLEFLHQGKIVPCNISAVDYRHYALLEWDLLFTNGRISVRDGGRTEAHYSVVDDSDYAGYRQLSVTPDVLYKDGMDGVLEASLNNLLDAARGRAPLSSSPQASLALMKILEQLQRI